MALLRRQAGGRASALARGKGCPSADRIERERVLPQYPPAGLLGLPGRQRLAEHLGERLPPPRRGEGIELRRSGGVRGVEQLRCGRQLERLPDHLRRAGDVRDREREVEEDVRVDVREPPRLAYVRVAVEEDER